MVRLAIILVTALCFSACSTVNTESATIEKFRLEADGFDHFVDKSILRVVNTDNDPDFNALIRDLDNVKVLSSSGGDAGAQALFKRLDKGISSEGYEEIMSVDNREVKCRLFERVIDEDESKWVLVFMLQGEAGVVEMNGTLDPAYLNSLSNMNFDKVKGLVESTLDIVEDDETKVKDKTIEVEVDL